MNKDSIVNKLRIIAGELSVCFNDVLSQFIYYI